MWLTIWLNTILEVLCILLLLLLYDAFKEWQDTRVLENDFERKIYNNEFDENIRYKIYYGIKKNIYIYVNI